MMKIVEVDQDHLSLARASTKTAEQELILSQIGSVAPSSQLSVKKCIENAERQFIGASQLKL